jgi:hypothetical protein
MHKLDASLPPRLFKYRPVNDHTQEIFSKQALFFANPTAFNDPVDSGFHIFCGGERNQEVIAAVASNAIRKAHPEWRIDQILDAAELTSAKVVADHNEEASRQLGRSLARDYNDKAGVFCLPGTSTDILMWSHYSNCHRGICLEFRTDVKDSIFAKAQPITYSDEYPHLDLRTIVESEPIRSAAAWMLTKSSQWSYEREWRVLDYENGPGVRRFPPSCLSAVILGCCISDEERELVLEWSRDSPTPVRMRKAKKSSTHFRLDVEEVS